MQRDAAQIKLLVASFAGLATGYSVFAGVVFGLFIEPLSGAFGWSRTAISGALTLCSASIVVLAPLAGALLDRHGVRTILIPSIGLFGVAVAALSAQTGQLWVFYGLAFAIALTGMATLPPTYSRMLVNAFSRRRGLALSIALSGVGVAAVVLPLVLERAIANYGWRTAYLCFALVVLLVGWPVVMAWLREVPPSTTASGVARPETSGSAFWSTRRALLRQTPLPRLAVACFLLGLSLFGVVVHFVPWFSIELGSTQKAAAAASLLGLSTFASRLLCGWLLDRVFAPYLAAGVFAVAALSLFYIGATDLTAGVLVAVALIGLANGADFDIISYLVSRYVPLSHYTWAYGVVYSAFLAGATVGPLLLGFAYDQKGSYALGVQVFAVAVLAAAGVFVTLGPYREPLHPNAE